MSTTSIEWTDRTWNPTRGCSRVSEGCRNCYAERQAARFASGQADSACREASGMESGGPFAGFVRKANGHPQWTGKVELIEWKLEEPLHWRKPARVFVNSMSDLFHEALPDEAIDRVFAVMALCPHHTFQVLTKRPERMRTYFVDFRNRMQAVFRVARGLGKLSGALAFSTLDRNESLPNVWLGVSVENQATADERIPLLLQTPAAVRFVSYEPALGPVDFDMGRCDVHDRDEIGTTDDGEEFCIDCAADERSGELSYGHWLDPLNGGIHWLIVGGESGPGARPFDLNWARSARNQCQATSVAFFMKQMGTNPIFYKFGDRKGGNMNEWPHDLRIREFPDAGSQAPAQTEPRGTTEHQTVTRR